VRTEVLRFLAGKFGAPRKRSAHERRGILSICNSFLLQFISVSGANDAIDFCSAGVVQHVAHNAQGSAAVPCGKVWCTVPISPGCGARIHGFGATFTIILETKPVTRVPLVWTILFLVKSKSLWGFIKTNFVARSLFMTKLALILGVLVFLQQLCYSPL